MLLKHRWLEGNDLKDVLQKETWFVDFYEGEPCGGKKIETKEVKRAYAPTRWANNHAFSLKRERRGTKVTYSIERMS